MSQTLVADHTQPTRRQQASRHLGAKLAIAIGCAVFFGVVAQHGMPGSVIAIAIGLALATMVFTQFRLGWNRHKVVLSSIAAISWCAVTLEPGSLNLTMMWLAFAGFALAQQHGDARDFLHVLHSALGALAAAPRRILGSCRSWHNLHQHLVGNRRLMTLANLLLPVLAIGLFGGLLIAANPMIEAAMAKISWHRPFSMLLSWMPLVTIATLPLIWALIKIRPSTKTGFLESGEVWQAQYFSPAPVLVTLFLLNGMFLAQNLLDLRYIWTDTILPPGMNHAEYVHRGSYALIATAVLAGFLVIFALQPGSRSAASPMVRGLVYLWIGQNVLLVISSIKRTLDYVDAYGMTMWRLSGMIWMALVAAGLIFIVARVVGRRSNRWLLNINLGAALAVLLLCGLIDLRAIVANWNVDQYADPRQMQSIDPEYMASLGPSAIPALKRLDALSNANLQTRVAGSENFGIVMSVQSHARQSLRETQGNWQSWTLRNAMIAAGDQP